VQSRLPTMNSFAKRGAFWSIALSACVASSEVRAEAEAGQSLWEIGAGVCLSWVFAGRRKEEPRATTDDQPANHKSHHARTPL
jgi:hypothetical protein